MKNDYEKTDSTNKFIKRLPTGSEVKVDLITGHSGGREDNKDVFLQGMHVWNAHGVSLALEFHQDIRISGTLPDGGTNSLTVRVPTISAYICVKGITLSERKKEKDAYDIYFCVANYQGGHTQLAREFQPLLHHELAREGLLAIKEKFQTIDSIGPVWAARVSIEATGGDEVLARRDAFEQVNSLLDELDIKA